MTTHATCFPFGRYSGRWDEKELRAKRWAASRGNQPMMTALTGITTAAWKHISYVMPSMNNWRAYFVSLQWQEARSFGSYIYSYLTSTGGRPRLEKP